jgi:hypothetical protein
VLRICLERRNWDELNQGGKAGSRNQWITRSQTPKSIGLVVRTKLFRCFMRMMRGVEIVTVSDVGMVRRFRMVAIRVVFRGFSVVLGGQLVVFGSFLVVFCDGVSLHRKFLRSFVMGGAARSPSRSATLSGAKRWRLTLYLPNMTPVVPSGRQDAHTSSPVLDRDAAEARAQRRHVQGRSRHRLVINTS